MNIKPLILVVLSLVLSACSSAPSSVILAPQVNNPTSSVYMNKQASLVVSDLRTQNHLIQILKTGKAAELLSPANDITATVNQSLSQQWTSQGLNIGSDSAINITVFIDAALVSVQQETVKYTAQSEIRLRVQIQKDDKTLTNHFKSKGQSNGPLSADIAVLERDFNQLFGRVIEEVMANQEIQNFIKE